MNGLGVLEQASELARGGEAFALATVVWRQGPSSGKQGSRAIITSGGELRGWIGGACAEPVVIREARQAIADGKARLLLLGTPGQLGGAVPEGMTVVPVSCASEGALEVYIEPVLPAPRLVVVGGSPMAHTLLRLARALGWSAGLVAGPDFTAGDADERSMVVVATQGHDDEGVIERAIAARPAYLGLVGSRKRGEAVLGYLAEHGLPRDQLDRVRVPAGLDLGRTTHEEIAVAILAELVKLRAAGLCFPGGASPPPSTPRLGGQFSGMGAPAPIPLAVPPDPPGAGPAESAGAAAHAVDPVCGMTVAADAAGRPLTRDGITYYFCCAGCRRAFAENPDAYLTERAAQ